MIGIGSKVWRFDENHRVYRKDGNGLSIGAPIWREHWRPMYVVSETRTSWLLYFTAEPSTRVKSSDMFRMPKKNPDRWWAASESEIENKEWVAVHRHRIASHVSVTCDHEVLRAVAKLIGYKESAK